MGSKLLEIVGMTFRDDGLGPTGDFAAPGRQVSEFDSDRAPLNTDLRGPVGPIERDT